MQPGGLPLDDPQDAGPYNKRALVHATLGDYEQALADANKALELQPTDNSFIIDTRGYVYLKAGQYEEAKQDYEELFARGFDHPAAILGGGLAYANLGDSIKAIGLLEPGLEEAKRVQFPDPQLTDLIALAEQALADLQ